MEDYGNMILPDMKTGRLFGSHYGEAAPWTLGTEGKGLIHKGKPYLWRAERGKGDPHHPDVLGVIEPSYRDKGITVKTDGLFTVTAQGGVEPAMWDHGDLSEFAQHHPDLTAPPSTKDKLNGLLDSEWNFAKVASAHHNWRPGTWGKGFVLSDGQPVTWSLRGGSQWDEPEAAGPHHSEYAMDMGLGENPEGYEQYSDNTGGWHTPIYIKPDGEIGEMGYWPDADSNGTGPFHQLPGLKPAPNPLDWHFGAQQDPYYDPEFDQESEQQWADRLGDEMVQDMHRKAPPGELQRRLDDGILPGQSGKGIELPDGTKYFWKTEGTFDWPHHDDMLRHLRIFNREGIKYLHVSKDGKVDDLGGWGGVSEEGWKF